MEKDFDRWNEKKKRLDRSEKPRRFFYKEGEVWWCGLGLNLGVETDGKNDDFERPVLIVKVFNREMVWVLPITSHLGPEKFYYPLSYGDMPQAVILSQLRTVSTRRLFRKIRNLPEKELIDVVDQCRRFLANETPPKGGESRSPKAIIS